MAEVSIYPKPQVWKTYRNGDGTPVMGEYAFMTEPDHWENDLGADYDYVECIEETWQLVETRVLKFGRTETWCYDPDCEEEFTLDEPAPLPHYCKAHRPE